MQNPPLIFSTTRYMYLRDDILNYDRFEAGRVEVQHFPDGERYQRIMNNINGRNVVLIGGTISDDDTLELYDLAYALQTYGAGSLTLVIPYFGYSTMERAVSAGEIVTAKTRAHLLSSIPRTNNIRLILTDLHSEGIPHYFEAGILPLHLYCKPIIMEAARELCGQDFVLASTDTGRAKWVESLANDMGVNTALIIKRRLSGSDTTVTSINADVAGKQVIIYDDMIRTGGSLLGAARAYREAGAKEIFVIASHGLFSNNGLDTLRQSGLIRHIVCTDTHPNAVALRCDYLTVKPVAGLVARTLATL